MSSFNHRLVLALLCVSIAACSDDSGENLPEGGFTTGEDSGTPTTSPSTTNNPATTNDPSTTSDGTTTETDSETLDPTTTTTGTETTDSTTNVTDGDTTTTTDADTTETTDPSTSSETTDATTAGMAECDNTQVEADEVCFVDGGTIATAAGGTDVAAGDFDGDGDFDVIVTSGTGNTVSVHLGDGTGGLGAAVTTAVGGNPSRVVAGELSGDASWDAVVANADDDTVSILIASGGGNFTVATLAVGDQPVGLGLGDLDGANGLDFAVANLGSVNYNTALNDGAGNFTVLGPWAPAGNVVEMRGIALGRIGAAGGTIDAFYGGGGFYAATNGFGDGTMQLAVSQGGNAGDDLGRMAGGDINDDNDLDVVAVDGDAARVYLGQGGADGAANFQSQALGPFMEVSEALLADMTGEGDQDVVVADRGANTVTVIPGFGDATFGDAVTFDVGMQPEGVAVADLDGDTVNDIIVVNATSGDLTILLSNP